VHILEDVKVAKPCFTEQFDVLQNRFFRPLERLIATDMPLHKRLIKALSSDDKTNNLVKIFTKLAGLPGLPDHIRAAYIVKKMSTVRHFHSSAFTPMRATQTLPHQMVPRIRLITGYKETSVYSDNGRETFDSYPGPKELQRKIPHRPAQSARKLLNY
jgi:hypothetical protein